MSIDSRADSRINIKKLVYLSILTACVVTLQCIASFLPGVLSVNLSLVPIVIGAAVCGRFAGGWLGLVCGFIILFDPTTSGFMSFNALATVILVLVKGVASGFLGGLVYSLFEKWNKYVAVLLSAIVVPVVNTGIFFVGCLLFFFDLFVGVAGGSVVTYLITVVIGVNFLFELGVNVVLAPTILRLINIKKS